MNSTVFISIFINLGRRPVHVQDAAGRQCQRPRSLDHLLLGVVFGKAGQVREGYANFAIDDPPLKLVLIEQTDARGSGVAGALNHLGVEVETADQVALAAGSLSDQGMIIDLRENTTCCYALQDKVWVDDPDGTPWEIYAVLADAEAGTGTAISFDSPCAGPVPSGTSAVSHCC